MSHKVMDIAKVDAITQLKGSITKYILLGSNTKTAPDLDTLISQLTNYDISVESGAINSYLLKPSKSIKASMIDLHSDLIVEIDIAKDQIPSHTFVHYVALVNDSNRVLCFYKFRESFSTIEGMMQTINVKIAGMLNDSHSSLVQDLTIFDNVQFYVRRSEMINWLTNHNHYDHTVSKKEFEFKVNELDNKKVDAGVIGDLSSVSGVDNANVTSICNAIINREGDLSTLNTDSKINLVSSINELKSNIGNLTTLEVPSTSLVEAINRINPGTLEEYTALKESIDKTQAQFDKYLPIFKVMDKGTEADYLRSIPQWKHLALNQDPSNVRRGIPDNYYNAWSGAYETPSIEFREDGTLLSSYGQQYSGYQEAFDNNIGYGSDNGYLYIGKRKKLFNYNLLPLSIMKNQEMTISFRFRSVWLENGSAWTDVLTLVFGDVAWNREHAMGAYRSGYKSIRLEWDDGWGNRNLNFYEGDQNSGFGMHRARFKNVGNVESSNSIVTHLTLVITPTESIIYSDASEVGRYTRTKTDHEPLKWVVFHSFREALGCGNTEIRLFRVWDKALTSTEVALHYNLTRNI